MDDEKQLKTYDYIRRMVFSRNTYMHTIAEVIMSKTGMDKEDIAQEIFMMMLEGGNIARMEPFTKKYVAECCVSYGKNILRKANADKRKVQYLQTELIERLDGTKNYEDELIEYIDMEKLQKNNYFTDDELAILERKKSCAEVAREKGISRQAVHARLKNKINKYKEDRLT